MITSAERHRGARFAELMRCSELHIHIWHFVKMFESDLMAELSFNIMFKIKMYTYLAYSIAQTTF